MVAPVNLEFRAQDKTGSTFSAIEARLTKLNTQLDAISGRRIINANQLDVRGVDRINTALGETARQSENAQRRTRGLGSAFGGLSTGALGIGVAAAGVAAFASNILDATDEMRNYQSQLKLVIDESENLRDVQQELFDVSQRTFTGFGTTVEGYVRVRRAIESTDTALRGSSITEVLESINNAFLASGANAEQSALAQTQLFQAFEGNRLRGEEFNSITEQASYVIQLLADSLGLTVTEMRAFSAEGLITTQELTDAFVNMRERVESEAGMVAPTLEREATRTGNAFVTFAANASEATGATEAAIRVTRGWGNILGFLNSRIDETDEEKLRRVANDIVDLDAEIARRGARGTPSDLVRIEQLERERERLQVVVDELRDTVGPDQTVVTSGAASGVTTAGPEFDEEERRSANARARLNEEFNTQQKQATAAELSLIHI